MLIYGAAMVHAKPTYNIHVYNFDEYVPITVFLLMLSEDYLLYSVIVLLEVPREVLRLRYNTF